jgi:hypothetical protein
LEETAVPVLFRADLDEEELQQKKGLASFLVSSNNKKRKRFSFFEKRNIRLMSDLKDGK